MAKRYIYPYSIKKMAAKMGPRQRGLILGLTATPVRLGMSMVLAERLAVGTVLRQPLVLKTPLCGDYLYSLTEAGLRVQALLREPVCQPG
jgi:hypothetical protein